MSKFQVGDKVSVNFVPGLKDRYPMLNDLFENYPCLSGREGDLKIVNVIGSGEDVLYELNATAFMFNDESLELV